jgi:excisionase family DNA binding protein
MPNRTYLNTVKAGKLIGVGSDTISNWIREKGLPALRLPSGRYRIYEKAFFAWLEKQGCSREEILSKP